MKEFAHIRAIALTGLMALVILETGCGLNEVGGSSGAGASNFTYRDTYAWPVSTPAAQGMDSARVIAGLQQIRNASFLTSILVVKNDFLVLEYYAAGTVRDNDFDTKAISGSFTSALTGIAIERGLLQSVNEKVLKFIPSFDTARIDPRKRTWTLEHLLTMKSGLDWNEYADHSALFNSATDWLNTALGLPLKYAPGDTFIFTSPNANILSAILTRVAGTSTYWFADQNLFEPLKISVRAWNTDPQGLYLGGTGMRFTPRDIGRFGQLYLHNGFLDGKQILSRSWVQQSLTPCNRQNTAKGDLTSLNFGYLWWTNYEGGDSLYVAMAYGGSSIYVVPARSMVIVTIADDSVVPLEAEANERAIIAIIKKYFL